MGTQAEIPLIRHMVGSRMVAQRATDGYVNATAMCDIVGKPFSGYKSQAATQVFLVSLAAETGLSVAEMIQVIPAGRPAMRATWVHPQVALDLGRWLSPDFAAEMTVWLTEWSVGEHATRAVLTDHIRRYLINQPKVPATHFSILEQMVVRLLWPLEQQGYVLPKTLTADRELDKMFFKWCLEQGHKPSLFLTYQPEFTDGHWPLRARLYPLELMAAFNIAFERWLRDGRAEEYFDKRDEEAIPALRKVIAALPASTDTAAAAVRTAVEGWLERVGKGGIFGERDAVWGAIGRKIAEIEFHVGRSPFNVEAGTAVERVWVESIHWASAERMDILSIVPTDDGFDVTISAPTTLSVHATIAIDASQYDAWLDSEETVRVDVEDATTIFLHVSNLGAKKQAVGLTGVELETRVYEIDRSKLALYEHESDLDGHRR